MAEPKTAEDLLSAACERASEPKPAPDAAVPRECDLEVHYQLGSGEVLRGSFRYQVPGPAQHRAIDFAEVALRQGVPEESYSAPANAQIRRDAYLQITLITRPAWCASLDDVQDPRILDQLYREACAYEARFLGAGRDLRPGAATGEGADGRGSDPGVVGGRVGPAESG